MLEITRIREEKDQVIEGLKKRNLDVTQKVNDILAVDSAWRAGKTELEDNLAKLNNKSKEIGLKKKANPMYDLVKDILLTDELDVLKRDDKKLKKEVNRLADDLQNKLYELPNVPNAIVPKGKTPEENLEVHAHGKIPTLNDNAVPHWDLAKKYNLIDFELGVKVTGAGFPFYIGKGARLQRALINFFLDQARDAGYQEIIPPFVVNEASGYGTGQLPDKEGQMYHAAIDDFYLIPTAEVPLTNMYRDVLLNESDFPIKVTGYTPCFRREAGSYGKDVRGLNRLHQFDKVEVVHIEHPSKSYETLDVMVKYVQSLLEKLELPYRTLRLCGGDMGFTSALTYDLEVFSAAQKKWLEVSSVSNFETFQANRLKLRYRDASGKNKLAHTLNGSALALPRILAALLENNQDANGINIPKVLVPYTGFDRI